MTALSSKTLTIFSLLGLALLACYGGCAAGESPKRGEWWFSTQPPPTGERRYHIAFTLNSPERNVRDHGEYDVPVTVKPTAEPEGLVWRLVSPKERYDLSNTLGLWMVWLQAIQDFKDRGTTVTSTEVLFGDWPLLRGPLRAGDRLMIVGFSFVGLVVHADVVSADSERVALRFDFWRGGSGFRSKGSGELILATDAAGLREVRAAWRGTFGSDHFDAVLTIDRLSQ